MVFDNDRLVFGFSLMTLEKNSGIMRNLNWIQKLTNRDKRVR